MSDLVAINPEIEGLLREVAADPDSCLLRLPSDSLRRGARRAELPDRAGLTGLRPAERELLRTWRRETAYLLLVACYRQQVTAPEHKHLVHRVSFDGRLTRFLDRPWARLGSTRLGLPSESALCQALALLAKCASPDGKRWPSVFELASAASRIEPSTASRNYAALDLILNGRPSSGVRMLEGLYFDVPVFQLMAASNRTLGYERMGRLERSYESVCTATWPSIGALQRSLFGAALSAQLGLRADAARWAARLEDAPASSEEFRILEEGLRERRRTGWWSARPGSAQMLANLARNFGPRTRSLASAFQ